VTEFLSATDIARLTRVKQAAVSNWRKRHRSFPDPTQTPAGERYAAKAVAAWLDQRRIPKNALLAGESPGATFGARFRANLTGDAGSEPVQPETRHEPEFRPLPAPPAARPRQDAVARLWSAMDRVRGVLAYDQLRDVVLGAFLAARTASPVAPRHLALRTVTGLLVQSEYWNPERADTLTRSIDSSGADLDDLVDVVSDLAKTEDAAGFDAVLDDFVARDDRRNAEFLTPESVTGTVVSLLEPTEGESILDPCCGSGSFLVSAAEYIRSTGRHPAEIRSTGWALNEDSLRLAKMRTAMHGLTGDGSELVLSDRVSSSATGVADVVLTNPPFNTAGLGFTNLRQRKWPFGEPPENNFNFGWLQLCLELLKPGGRAAVVMANGSMSSAHAAEKAIRQAMLEAGVVGGIVTLPRRLFPTTSVPVCLWLLRKPGPGKRPPSSVVMIDATGLGTTVGSARRVLSEDDIGRIADAWHGRGGQGLGVTVPIAEIRARDYRLNPAIYRKTAAGAELSEAITEVHGLRARLAQLLTEVARADEVAEQQLDRISSWNR
jgi:type I restriction enzyme M protein